MRQIGAAVWRLRAETGGFLPGICGRALHAAFFAALGAKFPALAAEIHDASRPNPFALSPLLRANGLLFDGRRVRHGDMLDLRVSVFSEEISDFVRCHAPDSLRVGPVSFSVERVMTERTEHASAGFVDADMLLEACASMPGMESATLQFLSPTMFHAGQDDFPWPLPSLVFGSLADRWAACGFPDDFGKRGIQEAAADVLPLAWQGGTQRVAIKPGQEKLAFTGTFSYDFRRLPEDARQRFRLLTRFAEFAGAGRMTAQGFGQVRVF